MMVELDADRRRAAVEDEIDAAVKVGQNVVRAGRRDVAGAVGRGRDHRLAERRQNGVRHLVIGHAHRDGIETGRRQVAHKAFGGLGQNERQRPRPERLGELQRFGVEAGERLRRLEIDDMGDQRIERRPALGLVEPRDSAPVGRIGAQAVDSFGRKRHQAAGGEDPRRRGDRSGVRLDHARRRRGCYRRHRVPR